MTATVIRPIETRYRGYRFRSRLEARWAVFFDTLLLPYEYETEGLNLSAGWYLPDFFLPSRQLYVEIKRRVPEEPDWIRAAQNFTEIASTGKAGIIILGQPWRGDFDVSVFGLLHRDYAFSGATLFGGDDSACRALDLYIGVFGNTLLEEAFTAARGARFEHGESGA